MQIEFKEVQKEYLNYPDRKTNLPERKTRGSAGYDFYLKDKVVLLPGERKLVFSDVKAYMPEYIYLELAIRSSIALKKGVTFLNSVGIIDSDYVGNKSNDGNIGFILVNLSKDEVVLEADTRIAQGIFKKYYSVTKEEDLTDELRVGGFGSTLKK